MEPAETIDPQDWTTIWQSEMSALAVDREAHEALVAFARAMSGGLDGGARGHDGPARRPGPDAPPGATPAGDVPGTGDEVARLRRRIAELERAAAGGSGS